jgi:large subunit ribosomal protein L18
MKQTKEQSRLKRRKRIRGKISGTAERPRLAVFRSNKGIYVQLIDDASATTIAAASSQQLDDAAGTKKERAAKVGQLIAERAKDKGIERVVFDRGGYLYHGRVAALADGAREGGLTF